MLEEVNARNIWNGSNEQDRRLKELTGLTCLKEHKGIIWAGTDETNQDGRTA